MADHGRDAAGFEMVMQVNDLQSIAVALFEAWIMEGELAAARGVRPGYSRVKNCSLAEPISMTSNSFSITDCFTTLPLTFGFEKPET